MSHFSPVIFSDFIHTFVFRSDSVFIKNDYFKLSNKTSCVSAKLSFRYFVNFMSYSLFNILDLV